MRKILLAISIVSLALVFIFAAGYFSRSSDADVVAGALRRGHKNDEVGSNQKKIISDIESAASGGQVSEPAWAARHKDVSAAEKGSERSSGKKPQQSDEFLAAIAQLQQLQASDAPDPKAAAAALAQLEKANGSPLLHGLRLDVLRNNLELTAKITAIAESNKQAIEAGSTAPLDPASMRQREAMSRDQVEALRKQINMDFIVSKPQANQP